MMYYSYKDTPAGTILLIGDGEALAGLHWQVFSRAPAVQPGWTNDSHIFKQVISQLDEYFAGTRKSFDIKLAAVGTAFQKQVWHELTKIPFGASSSYKAIAGAIGRPKAVRAVGTAVGSNPFSIIVPCHRVLTSGNKLGGYAGGLAAKRVLLEIETIAWNDK